jgi:hypothetical protein
MYAGEKDSLVRCSLVIAFVLRAARPKFASLALAAKFSPLRKNRLNFSARKPRLSTPKLSFIYFHFAFCIWLDAIYKQ